jgi:hypothetical protein
VAAEDKDRPKNLINAPRQHGAEIFPPDHVQPTATVIGDIVKAATPPDRHPPFGSAFLVSCITAAVFREPTDRIRIRTKGTAHRTASESCRGRSVDEPERRQLDPSVRSAGATRRGTLFRPDFSIRSKIMKRFHLRYWAGTGDLAPLHCIPDGM